MRGHCGSRNTAGWGDKKELLFRIYLAQAEMAGMGIMALDDVEEVSLCGWLWRFYRLSLRD